MSVGSNVPEKITSNNNNDPKQLYRGRFLSFCMGIVVDDAGYLVKIEKGRVVSVVPMQETSDQPLFTYAASSDNWEVFAQKYPPPGYQDVMAMVECGHATLTGEVFPIIVNLFFVKGIVNGLRMREIA